MSTDELPIDEYAQRVEQVLDERRAVSALWPLIGTLALAGLLLTLALRTEADWLYIVGLALTAVCAAGFFLARGEARWYRW